jgi:hypothetical protein
MACLTNLVSQPSLDISHIWVPLSAMRLETQQGRSVLTDRFFMCLLQGLIPECSVFTSKMALAVGTNWFHNILQLILSIGVPELGLLARFGA